MLQLLVCYALLRCLQLFLVHSPLWQYRVLIAPSGPIALLFQSMVATATGEKSEYESISTFEETKNNVGSCFR